MPTVTLSDVCDRKLKALVTEPFEETRQSIIEDLVDAELDRRPISPNGNGRLAPAPDDVRRLSVDNPGSLLHTRVLAAAIDDRDIHRPKWKSINEAMHILGLKRLGSFDALRQQSSANLRAGKYEDNGYTYLPDGDFSMQGAGADRTWDHILRVARKLNVAIRIEFEWRDKDGAAHPGERGVLEWRPDET